MKPDYKDNDPKGWCGDPSRGAALGRACIHEKDFTAKVKLYLRQVRIDSAGYDPNGTYFGIGKPLYWYADTEGEIDAVLRANDRTDAKDQIRERYPEASFFR